MKKVRVDGGFEIPELCRKCVNRGQDYCHAFGQHFCDVADCYIEECEEFHEFMECQRCGGSGRVPK